ncbi:MAG: DUF924 family protein [Rhodoplanes sp.]
MTEARGGSAQSAEPAGVLAYWRALGPDKWFVRDAEVDVAIRSRYFSTYQSGIAGELSDWEQTAEGALALILVLDQFPRNMFRGTARAFAADPLARGAAARAIARRFDCAFATPERRFFYIPFMHSEDLRDQERCIKLCREADDSEGVTYAEAHADIIRRFGRFPHRNAALGRTTTPDEQAFLDAGGFAG